MKTIGIDIGTTTISGVVLALDKQAGQDGKYGALSDTKTVLTARTIPNDSFIKTDFAWERIQDVDIILEKAKGLLDDLLMLHPDTEAIGLTGQMHGIVYLDQSGNHVSPLFTWQDGRGELAVFEGKSLVHHIFQETGLTVPSGYGLVTHLYHCKKNLIPAGSASIGTIADYFGMKLTGRRTPLVHISNAASMGFFDGQHGIFQEDALKTLGMDTALLPEVSKELVVIGKYRDIPVITALGDNQASFLGAAGIAENTVLLNMGTGGQISVLSGHYFEIPEIETRPFLKDKFLLVGASLCGGSAYAVLEKFFRSYAVAAGLKDQPQYEIMAGLAEQAIEDCRARQAREDCKTVQAIMGCKAKQPATGQNRILQDAAATKDLQVITAFHGTRTNPDLRGSIYGISEDNFTPGNLVLGFLKGMASELYDMYQKIYEATNIRAEHLVASGNGLRKNPVLQDIFRQMFQTDLTLSLWEEEAACGAVASWIHQPVDNQAHAEK